MRQALLVGAALLLAGCLSTKEPVFDATNSLPVGEIPEFLAYVEAAEAFSGPANSPRKLVAEGARGTGKLYRDRYKLVRFGTGFMRLALKMKTPIYPFAFIGGEEAFPTLFHIKGLHKLIGAPYVPVAPQLVIWPLPVSCQIHYGKPLEFDGDGSETDDVIHGYVEQVKDSIRELIRDGLAARPAAFTRQTIPNPNDPTRPELQR